MVAVWKYKSFFVFYFYFNLLVFPLEQMWNKFREGQKESKIWREKKRVKILGNKESELNKSNRFSVFENLSSSAIEFGWGERGSCKIAKVFKSTFAEKKKTKKNVLLFSLLHGFKASFLIKKKEKRKEKQGLNRNIVQTVKSCRLR